MRRPHSFGASGLAKPSATQTPSRASKLLQTNLRQGFGMFVAPSSFNHTRLWRGEKLNEHLITTQAEPQKTLHSTPRYMRIASSTPCSWPQYLNL
ncbi:hypothetical protein HBH71_129580 [Parastagonospora nodorum]|nr:hypothetical protein HBH97_203710 [Parastagonospora nodorum]KAH5116016.1 hypothetical protein HBH71_129580 [Parastagonospora nodorum]KAH6462653.1 hypothetical protein HBI57_066840 [Parastagonospora nodorum]